MRAVLAALLLVACSRGGQTGLDLPRYPGSMYYPHERLEVAGAVVYRAQLDTPDSIRTVNEWYDGILGAMPGWVHESSVGETIWSNRNLEWEGGLKVRVLDARKRGAMLIIVDVGMKTEILLFESTPVQ